jgi:hypothetical protein
MISLRRHTLTKLLIILISQLCLVKNEPVKVTVSNLRTTSVIQVPNNENITSYSSETTKTTTTQPASSSSLYPTTTTRIDYNKIYEQFGKQQAAEQCAYGYDPMLSDLYPQELLNALANSSIPLLATIRLNDLTETVFENRGGICSRRNYHFSELEECLKSDLWNLEKHRSEESGTNSSTNATLGLTSLQSEQLFCMIQSCFKHITYYAEKCVKSNFTLDMMKLAPFCEYNDLLNQIQLRKQAHMEQCAYGEDPMLSDLCPQELFNAPAYSSIPQLATIRLHDLQETVLDNLGWGKVCPWDKLWTNKWCLEFKRLSVEKYLSEIDTNSSTLGLTFLQNQQLFCMIKSCFNNINYYREKCVKNKFNRGLIYLAPKFCNYNIENNDLLIEVTNNLNQINEQLRKQQAEQCAYGEDPLLSELCPNELLNAPAYSSIPLQLATTRLQDVTDRILDKRVLDNLEQVCPIGEWCLEYDLLSLEKHRSAYLGLTFLQNQQLFCVIQSCFNNINYYAEKCVKSNLTLNMIKLAPIFCNYNIEDNENEYCTENAWRLLHVSAAFSEINEKTNTSRTIDVG